MNQSTLPKAPSTFSPPSTCHAKVGVTCHAKAVGVLLAVSLAAACGSSDGDGSILSDAGTGGSVAASGGTSVASDPGGATSTGGGPNGGTSSSGGSAGGSITDADGNFYETVDIGKQVWMKENLRTTEYNDGTSIPLVTDNVAWEVLTSPGYCWYENDESVYKDTYGALYNWHTVKTGKLCPEGWHVPSENEWTELYVYLQNNGYNYDGSIDSDNDRSTNNKIAKAMAATELWQPSDVEGAVGNLDFDEYRNKSGFSAYPAGERYHDGSFRGLGSVAAWWSSTEDSRLDYLAKNSFVRKSDEKTGSGGSFKTRGISVRCLKD